MAKQKARTKRTKADRKVRTTPNGRRSGEGGIGRPPAFRGVALDGRVSIRLPASVMADLGQLAAEVDRVLYRDRQDDPGREPSLANTARGLLLLALREHDAEEVVAVLQRARRRGATRRT